MKQYSDAAILDHYGETRPGLQEVTWLKVVLPGFESNPQLSTRLPGELSAEVASSPRALPERIAEARRVGHMALSLVGEPVLYPHVSECLDREPRGSGEGGPQMAPKDWDFMGYIHRRSMKMEYHSFLGIHKWCF